jgi:hypothetical protein
MSNSSLFDFFIISFFLTTIIQLLIVFPMLDFLIFICLVMMLIVYSFEIFTQIYVVIIIYVVFLYQKAILIFMFSFVLF